jgi:hypothetical protein
VSRSIPQVTTDGFTLVLYPGSNKVLLAMSLDQAKLQDTRGKFAGFAIWRTSNGKTLILNNRLSFTAGVSNETTAKTHVWTPTDQAPLQKFRWVDVPPDGFNGPLTYRVQLRYFDSDGGSSTHAGAELSLTVNPALPAHANFQPAFTRGFVASQAYVDKFKNAPLRPDGAKDPEFDTSTFQNQYTWLGADARKALFDFIADCESDAQCTVDVFAYDLDEPDVIKAMCGLGKKGKLRAVLDNAPLHSKPNKSGAPPVEVASAKLVIDAAGAKNVRQGHFNRFQHNKVFIKRNADRSKASRVLFGSMNFSVRGIYVQANNIIVVDDEGTAGAFAAAFDNAFENNVNTTKFYADKISQSATICSPANTDKLPKFSLTLSPHKNADTSLKPMTDCIQAAQSSVLFAVMEPTGSGGVLSSLRTIAANPTVFSYGTVETDSGIAVQSPNGAMGEVTPFAALAKNVPPPFSQETTGGPGMHIHDKFVVVDFQSDHATVFTGSSNLAAGGETANGDSLAMIEDVDIATMYAIEAVATFDHFHFRKVVQAATKVQPLTLWAPNNADQKPAWYLSAYDLTCIQMRDRLLFAQQPLPSGLAAKKEVDWSAVETPKTATKGKATATKSAAAGTKKAPAKKSVRSKAAPKKAGRKSAAVKTARAKKAVAKKTARKTAGKTAARKSPPKKVAVKRSRVDAKKAATKKATAKKATAKKATAKKATAKKATAKKATAKKATAKKAGKQKAAGKKASAKKVVAKKRSSATRKR